MRWSLIAVFGSFALAGLLPCASALTISGSVFQGSPAPGGGTFSTLESASLNDNGAIAFVADVSGATASQGVFLVYKGAVTSALLQGSAVPGGGTFSAFDSVSLNDGGVVAFVADVSGGASGQGLFLINKSTVTAVVLQGSPAPGGGTFSTFESASLNNNGAIAFVADISGGTASQGIFLINKGAVTAVALQGSLAPGGGTFSAFDSVSLNDSAVIAFVADVSGGTASQGIFLINKGTVTAAVLQGSPAPGSGTFSTFESASVNNNGAIAFVADIGGGTASQGLFLINKGKVNAVALQGSPAPGGGTFAAFESASLSNNGGIAFLADVSGGTANQGIFFSS